MHFFLQVLSLNLTNLLIIALLKILVFAAGIIGANHFKHNGSYGRHQEPSHYGELLTIFHGGRTLEVLNLLKDVNCEMRVL